MCVSVTCSEEPRLIGTLIRMAGTRWERSPEGAVFPTCQGRHSGDQRAGKLKADQGYAARPAPAQDLVPRMADMKTKVSQMKE